MSSNLSLSFLSFDYRLLLTFMACGFLCSFFGLFENFFSSFSTATASLRLRSNFDLVFSLRVGESFMISLRFVAFVLETLEVCR